MKKTIARALWMFTLATFAGTACNSNFGIAPFQVSREFKVTLIKR
jgi:hypothetical protein